MEIDIVAIIKITNLMAMENMFGKIKIISWVILKMD
jgi:hypothetical protein